MTDTLTDEGGDALPLDVLASELPPTAAPDTAATPDAAAAPVVPTADVLRGLLVPLLDALAPAWSISDAECAALAAGWAPVVDKYLPADQVSSWGPWVGALGVTVAVLGPRWGTPRQEGAPRKESAPANSPGVARASDDSYNADAPPEPAPPVLQ